MGTLYIGHTPVAPIIGSNKSTGNSEFAEKLFKGTVTKITQGNLNGITEIYPYMFAAQKDLESADIPEGVTVLRYGAFNGSAPYYSHTFDETTGKVTTTMSLKHYNKTKFTTIKLPSTCTSIGPYAFVGCPELANIEWPNGCNLKFIDEQAFKGTKIATFRISSLYDMGTSVFENCAALTNVDFTGCKLQIIKTACFKNCTSLTSVTLPSKITDIYGEAFYGCTSLKSITLPADFGGFSGASVFEKSGVTEVIYPGSKATLREIISENTEDWDFGFTEKGKFICNDGNLIYSKSLCTWVKEE